MISNYQTADYSLKNKYIVSFIIFFSLLTELDVEQLHWWGSTLCDMRPVYIITSRPLRSGASTVRNAPYGYVRQTLWRCKQISDTVYFRTSVYNTRRRSSCCIELCVDYCKHLRICTQSVNDVIASFNEFDCITRRYTSVSTRMDACQSAQGYVNGPSVP